MNPTLVEFAVQSLAGIVGVFVGVWLALVVDRRKRLYEEQKRAEASKEQFERALGTILGSVVKNMSEARRIRGLLARRGRCGLIHDGLETSVWKATQDQFMEHCGSIDKRLIFAQFFNGVDRLQAFCEFHRGLQLTLVNAPVREDPELAAIGQVADLHLVDLAEDLTLCGRLLVTDHGQPIHQRLLGMKPASSATDSHHA